MKSHEIQYRHGPIQQSVVGEEFKELTNPGHEVKHDLAYSVDSSWYDFVYRHSNGNSLWKLSGL